MVFHLKMLLSMVYTFLSRLLLSHCFLSCCVCGSFSWSFTNFSSFMGREMSVFTCTGSACWMFMLPISHSMTSSITWVVPGGSSLNGKYPISFPSSSGYSLMFSPISMSLERVSAKVFRIPGNVLECYVL